MAPPPNYGETADLASMAAIASIMAYQFRRSIEHIRQQALTSSASRTDLRETEAIASARSAESKKAQESA